MRQFSILFACAAVLAGMSMARARADAPPVAYPDTAKVDQVEMHFGVRIADPYRWLENDVRQDSRVRAWVDEQNRVAEAYLSRLPQRDAIKKRLTQLEDFEHFDVPRKQGGRYFFLHNDGLQNQPVLYVQDRAGATMRSLLDPNDWSTDGAAALAQWEPSPDGKRVVYAIQDSGSDWRTVKVVEVASGAVLSDVIRWVKNSRLAWDKDGSGFFYSRFPEPAKGEQFQSVSFNHAIYFHRLGDPQAADRLVYATPDRVKLKHVGQTTDDGRWLVITSSQGTDDRHEISIQDLRGPKAKPRVLFKGYEYGWSLAGSQDSTLYFVTNRDAPRYRIVSVDAAAPGEPAIKELVAQATATLQRASLIGDKLVAGYLEDVKGVVRLFALDGTAKGTVGLPGIGTVSGFSGEAGDSEAFYSFESLNTPAMIYRFDASSGTSTVFKQPKTPFDPGHYEVRQVFYHSKDGTRVPMFIAHRKGLDLRQGVPTLLYGYGGFNIPATPFFSSAELGWMEMGGVYALANLRGGGEYGKAWHDAGRLLKKQNVFDDFIAAAEYLIREGITTRHKLAIKGESNGGLVVATVVNQRPDLFAAALPGVGVMDMLRFTQFTAGRYWVDDLGDPAEEKHFRNLLAYSPYHNIKSGRDYPAILVTTADTDDRVVPGHSFKYTAALQAADIGSKPHLIRVETRAGHGSGKPTDKAIEEYADMWAFIGWHTGLTGAAAN